MTLSVPTMPDAEEESPYEICHLELFCSLYVEDFVGSKIVWPVPCERTLEGRSVDQH